MPSNTDITTATDIGALTGTTAYTTTEDAWNGATTDTDLWFKYQMASGDEILEISGTGDVTNYRVQGTVWVGPLGAPTQISDTADNRPMQQDIASFANIGDFVYLKFHKVTGNHNPSILTLRVARGQQQTLAVGDLFINDSTSPYPGIVMDPTTAIPKRYIRNFPAGEGVQILTNGVIAVQDDANGRYQTFDVGGNGMTLRGTVTNPFTPVGGAFDALGSNQVDTFWGADTGGGATHGQMFGFDASGSVTHGPLDVGSVGLKTVAPNSGNTKVYFAKNVSSNAQALFVITNPGAVVSTFLAGVSGKFYGANLFMLTDDTLLIPYEASGVDTIIKRYNESGTLLNTYTLSAATAPAGGLAVQGTLERIFASAADPSEFGIWYQDTTKNYFERVNVSTGTRTLMGSRLKFIVGVSQEGATASPSAYSGADFSCVPILLRSVGCSKPSIIGTIDGGGTGSIPSGLLPPATDTSGVSGTCGAVEPTAAGDGLTRVGTYLDPTQDWTRASWVYYASTAPATSYSAWFWGNDYAASVYGIGINAYVTGGQFVQDIEAKGSLVTIPLASAGWHHVAVRYTSATHVIDLYVDGTLAASVTVDLSALAPPAVEAGAWDGNGAVAVPVGFTQDRIWQSALTTAQIVTEKESARVIVRTNLLTDTPLSSATDLADGSGHGRDWTVSGTMKTITGPMPTIGSVA